MDIRPEDMSPKVPTVDEMLAAMPMSGLTLRDMRRMWPAEPDMAGVVKKLEVAGQLKFNGLSGRYQLMRTIRQVVEDKFGLTTPLQPPQAAHIHRRQRDFRKKCEHPKCMEQFSGPANARFCVEHRDQKWVVWRGLQRKAAAAAATQAEAAPPAAATEPVGPTGRDAHPWVTCAHPDCGVGFEAPRTNVLYCEEHRSAYWSSWRFKQQEKQGVPPPTKAKTPARRNSVAGIGKAQLELPARAGIRAYTNQAGNSLVVRIEDSELNAVELVGGQVGAFHEWLTDVMTTARQTGHE